MNGLSSDTRERTWRILAAAALLAPSSSGRADGGFNREISLLGGTSTSGGNGLISSTAPAAGFMYARSFKEPKPDEFLLRVIADTLVTSLETADVPWGSLAANQTTRGVHIRFGFSGCYFWGTSWLGCLDDGPRISYLTQADIGSQVVGSFPLGISVHNSSYHPWSMMARAEFGRWQNSEYGKTQTKTHSMFFLGTGYNW